MQGTRKVNGEIKLKNCEESKLKALYPALQKYCMFLSKSRWEGEDLAQETILKAINHYPSSRLTSALLNKMAYHRWVDHGRKRKSEVIGISEHFSEKKPIRPVDSVDFILKRLTPKQAIIFTLKEAFRFQSSEIAEVLGMSETAVKASVHRARKRLENETVLRPVDTFEDDAEKERLSEWLDQSLISEDPTVLIKKVSTLPSFTVRAKKAHSSLSPYCLAA